MTRMTPKQKAKVEEAATVATYCLKEKLDYYEGGHTRRTYPKGTRVADVCDGCLQWLKKNDPDGGVYVERLDLPDDEAADRLAAIAQAEADVAAAVERSTEAAGAVVAATDAESIAAAATHNDAMSTALQQSQRALSALTSEV